MTKSGEGYELLGRLQEAEDTIRAIREGTVDAFVVHESDRYRIYTLDGAQRPYGLLIEQVQQGALMLYTDGTIAYANVRLADMLGVAHAQLGGVAFGDFVAPADQAAFDLLFREARGASSHGEVQLQAADGSLIPVHLTCNALPADSGASVGVLVTDLTAQRHQQTLKLTNERLVILSDALESLLSAQDPQQVLRDLFQRVSAHLGVDTYLNYLVNRNSDTLELESCAGIPEEALPGIRRLRFGQGLCGTIAEKLEPLVVEDLQSSNDEKVAFMRGLGVQAYAGNPLLSGGRVLGTLCFARRGRPRFEEDEVQFIRLISRYVSLAMERAQVEQSLRDAARAKDEFLAMLSHELRNPLGAISSASLLLGSVGQGLPVIARVHQVISRQVDHLSRLVDDLLDIGRLTTGRIALNTQPVDLAQAAERFVASLRSAGRLDQHQVVLSTEAAWAEADPTRLEQIFANLIGNALKFTPKGGSITLCVRREGEDVVIEVEDTGIGIPEPLIGRVFDMFVQAAQSPDRAQGGLGIGLTLVRNLVEQHGGSVSVRSAGSGQGSAFAVRLPAIAPAPRPAAAEAAPRPIQVRRILIVEDNDDARETLRLALELAGHTVFDAANGAAGIELVARMAPDVALIDLGLPGLSGFEVAKAIRASAGPKPTTLIALTGYGLPEDRRRAEDAGFDLHLVKPVDFAKLLEVISEAPRLR